MKRRASVGGHLPGDSDCTVYVSILRAEQLAAKSTQKKHSNPFALLRIGSIERRTKTVHRSLSPLGTSSLHSRASPRSMPSFASLSTTPIPSRTITSWER